MEHIDKLKNKADQAETIEEAQIIIEQDKTVGRKTGEGQRRPGT